MAYSFRKHLSAPGLMDIVFKEFSTIPDSRISSRKTMISLTDHLMSGLAIFSLKCPSLLDYDRKRSDGIIADNLHSLYHVNTPPCDTYLRERLDEVDPDNLRPVFTKVFAAFQRGKGLEEYEYMDGYVLLSGDARAIFLPAMFLVHIAV